MKKLITKIKKFIPESIKNRLVEFLHSIWLISLKKAIEEQGLADLVKVLRKIVPDINNQYTKVKLKGVYIETKVRAQHAFQIALVKEALRGLEKSVIVDIGDSSGTHLQYIKELYSGKKDVKLFSVNIDGEAVRRIRARGFEAIHAKAEDIENYNFNTDAFLCFETLEHLMNPCYFLHELSSKTNAKYFIMTVPYMRKSRVGLYHIRKEHKGKVYAENTHIFELSPDDWKLIVKHSGWEVVKERIYLQYPRRNILRVTGLLWRLFDFEGFYGLVLRKDNSWTSRYMDW